MKYSLSKELEMYIVPAMYDVRGGVLVYTESAIASIRFPVPDVILGHAVETSTSEWKEKLHNSEAIFDKPNGLSIYRIGDIVSFTCKHDDKELVIKVPYDQLVRHM